jgi:putative transposase
VRHLDRAFRHFFAGRATSPAFHTQHGRQAATDANSAFRWDAQARTLTLAKMAAHLNIRWSRPFTGAPTTVTLSKDAAGRSFVSFLVEEEIAALPVITALVGVDVGVNDLAVLSTGEQVANPKHLRQSERTLAPAQRTLARKQQGSKNREQARLKVAREHARMADRRLDGLHTRAPRPIRENHTICVESLAVKHLARNHALAKAIADAGWGEFVRQRTYKAQWSGRTLVKIDRWYPSSKRCHACGHILASLSLDVRQWVGPGCGVRHDRDLNAAQHLLAVGRTVNAGGVAVRPGRAMPDPARPDAAGILRLEPWELSTRTHWQPPEQRRVRL